MGFYGVKRKFANFVKYLKNIKNILENDAQILHSGRHLAHKIDHGTHKKNNSKNTRNSSPPGLQNLRNLFTPTARVKNKGTPISLKAAFRHLRRGKTESSGGVLIAISETIAEQTCIQFSKTTENIEDKSMLE